jgi:lipase
MIECSEHYVAVDGIELCWFEWNASRRADGTILLVHATGFHARCWDQTVALLGDRHVIAVDMRGHGRSTKVPPYAWGTFGSDLVNFILALDLSRITGAGHSMGGHSLTRAAAALPDRFDRLVLIDPVILAPAAYANHAPNGRAEDHPVARRRNLFDSPDALFANLVGRGSFAHWQPEVLHDYCNFGVLPNPDGPGFVLACPPLVEATIYTGSAGTDIYNLIEAIALPVVILRAEQRDAAHTQMDFSKSPTWPELSTRFRHGIDVYLPQLTHFIPMQAPSLVAETILTYPVNP